MAKDFCSTHRLAQGQERYDASSDLTAVASRLPGFIPPFGYRMVYGDCDGCAKPILRGLRWDPWQSASARAGRQAIVRVIAGDVCIDHAASDSAARYQPVRRVRIFFADVCGGGALQVDTPGPYLPVGAATVPAMRLNGHRSVTHRGS